MTSYQVGAQMYSVRDRCQTYEGLLAALKELKAGGYNTCQISGVGKDISAEEIRRACDLAEVTCTSTHIGFEEMEQDIEGVIRRHEIMGCKYPGIGGLPAQYRESSEGYLEFAKRATAVAEKLEKAGMHFIYHSHHFEFKRLPDGKVGYDVLVENSSNALQMELDCFWAQVGGQNVLETIRRLKGRMEVIHFKDLQICDYPNIAMTSIGDGAMDYKAIMAAAEEIGVKYAYVEQDNAVDAEGGSVNCLVRSAQWLKANGARL